MGRQDNCDVAQLVEPETVNFPCVGSMPTVAAKSQISLIGRTAASKSAC